MHRKNRYLASLSLVATLSIPAVFVACSSPQPTTVTVNENHHWDDHENSAWHRFLAEKNRPDHEYAKSEKNEQDEYWGWRHSHPD